MRATAAVALQQTVQGITHVSLLIFFSAAAGATADLSHSYRRPRSCTWWLTEKGHDLTVRSGMLVTDHPAHEEVPRLHV